MNATRYKALFGGAQGAHRHGRDHTSLRQDNLSVILRRVWCVDETSRAELARELGLSRSAVSTLVEPLLNAGLIEEGGAGHSTGGRKPRILRFNPEGHFILGVDLGATHVSVIAIDLNGNVKGWRVSSCDVRAQPTEALRLINSLCQSLINELQGPGRVLLGVGLAAPSPISESQATKLSPLFMPLWSDVDLATDLKLPPRCPLIVDNDANAGALAEMWWGSGRESTHIAFLKLGTGVGGGFVVHGEVFRGHSGLAGEIGHLVINPEGDPCVCGLRGCLATYVGSGALLSKARSLSTGGDTSLYPNVEALITALREGDPVARAVITEAGEHLGLAVAGLLSIMNPERILIGGALAEAGEALLHPLRDRLLSRSLWTALSTSRIQVSELGERGVALGAATLVLQSALAHPERFFRAWSDPV